MRANVTVDASIVDQWVGNDMSVDHHGINFMDPDFVNESFNQGY